MIDRASGRIEHRVFRDVGEYLSPGDVIVANDSRVLPARLQARKPTGGQLEVLLIQPETPEVWRALFRPGKRVRQGMVLDFDAPTPAAQPLQAEVLESTGGEGVRRLRFLLEGEQLQSALEAYGSGVLP